MTLSDLGSQVAAFHLAVRQQQVRDGENDFPDILDSQTDLTDLDGYYRRPGGNFWIARTARTHRIVGCVGLRNVDGVGHVKRLAVHPAMRRRGLATRLMCVLVAWAKGKGFGELTLATGAGEHAHRIYHAVGFGACVFDDDAGDWIMTQRLTALE